MPQPKRRKVAVTFTARAHGGLFRERDGQVAAIMTDGCLVDLDVRDKPWLLDYLSGAEPVTAVRINGQWFKPCEPLEAAALEEIRREPFTEESDVPMAAKLGLLPAEPLIALRELPPPEPPRAEWSPFELDRDPRPAA